jgi:hypothetical protein
MSSRCEVRRLVWLALPAVLASCDPQAKAGYLGEPLVTLHGQVLSSGAQPALDAAMLWQRGPPPSTNDQELATRAPVESGFPSTFTLHLYQPPPAAALRALAPGEALYARANAAAVPAGTAGAAGAAVGPLPPSANPGYALDVDHWIVYLASEVPSRSLMEWWLGAALPAGFHLLRMTPVNPQCLTGTRLAACVADLVQRGVADDATNNAGTARSFCLQPYRLAVAPAGEELVLQLGTVTPGAGGACG